MRPSIMWALAMAVVGAGAAYTPAVARNGSEWTLPYSGTVSSSGAGFSMNNTGVGQAIYGESDNGWSIWGYSAGGIGLAAQTRAASAYAVAAANEASTGNAIGVYATTSSPNGYGVYGANPNSGGTGAGVYGTTSNGNGYGVTGVNTSNNAAERAVGVFGSVPNIGAGVSGYGVFGSAASNGVGVYGANTSNSAGVGVLGYNEFATATEGITSTGTGVYGLATSSGTAVSGQSHSGNGIMGASTSGYAGYFAGPVQINGSFTATGAKSFKIDHPLDPANKYLVHACIESNEMKDVYDGVAVCDSEGRAAVHLPAYFEALNKDFRYQLTCIGGFAPVYVEREIAKNSFTIAGGDPGMKVSWQVTGVRHDAWAEAHPLQVEPEKPQGERGRYLHPVELRQPESLGIDYEKLSGLNSGREVARISRPAMARVASDLPHNPFVKASMRRGLATAAAH